MEMEAVVLQAMVHTYTTTQCQIPEDHNLNTQPPCEPHISYLFTQFTQDTNDSHGNVIML